MGTVGELFVPRRGALPAGLRSRCHNFVLRMHRHRAGMGRRAIPHGEARQVTAARGSIDDPMQASRSHSVWLMALRLAGDRTVSLHLNRGQPSVNTYRRRVRLGKDLIILSASENASGIF